MKGAGLTCGVLSKRPSWRAGEGSGIAGVAVKCVEIGRNTSGEGGFLDGT